MSLKTKISKNLPAQTDVKRGDTIIEVMFAIAIFSLVAVLSIAMMNAGIASGERSLELVTARNELNAQAEALRFVHRSYVSEQTLPQCSDVAAGTKCQQYDTLWKAIVSGARTSSEYNIPSPLGACQEVYENSATTGKNLLAENNAFILNVRKLNDAALMRTDTDALNSIYISSANNKNSALFQPATLNARIVYSRSESSDDDNIEDGAFTNVSTTDPLLYTNVARIDGMWVVAVRDDEDRYYDFYIETCWYGSNSKAPTSLDAVIRLYNPEYMK